MSIMIKMLEVAVIDLLLFDRLERKVSCSSQEACRLTSKLDFAGSGTEL